MTAILRVVFAAVALSTSLAAQEPARTAFVDKTLGYELRLPADWAFDRTAFFGPQGAVGLLRGASPDGSHALQVLAYRVGGGKSFAQWVQQFVEDMRRMPGLAWARATPDEGPGRAAAYAAAESLAGIDRIRTYYRCVQFDATTIWVLSFTTAIGKASASGAAPEESGLLDSAPPAFREIAGSLRVFYDEKFAEQMREALERGRKYLEQFQLQEDVRALRGDPKPRCYRITLAGKPIGFMTREIQRRQHSLDEPRYRGKGKDGVRVLETTWRFGEDGSVRQGVLDLFSSVDAATDLFDVWEAFAPADGATAAITTRDECIREGDLLVFSQLASTGKRLPEPRPPIRVSPTYLGLGWARLLPALLGEQAKEPIAFAIFDTETKGLTNYMLRWLGDRALPGGKPAPCFEIRDGFVETPAHVYVDEFGQVLRVEAGELVVALTPQADIEREFGKRRDEARQRFSPSRKP